MSQIIIFCYQLNASTTKTFPMSLCVYDENIETFSVSTVHLDVSSLAATSPSISSLTCDLQTKVMRMMYVLVVLSENENGRECRC